MTLSILDLPKISFLTSISPKVTSEKFDFNSSKYLGLISKYRLPPGFKTAEAKFIISL
jgi:hypothetical protein